MSGRNVLFLFNNYTLDSERRELRADSAVIAIEPQVFDVLLYLIENRDRVVSKDDLIESVWGGRIVSESTLTSRINAVRKALGDSGEKQDFVRTFARKGFRFVATVEIKDKAGKALVEQDHVALTVPQKPSIAVLPFSNMSGDPEQDPLVDGITEEIITALSRVRWFFVIARGSAFAYKRRETDPSEIARELGVRYILMGSVRHAGDRIRVSAQLIDSNSRGNVWARSYDRALSDIFSVQDDITQTIVGAIEPELGRAERERARIKQRESIDAWSVYQRGMFHLYRYTQDDLVQARKLFKEAIAIDPDLAPAYSAIAEACYYEVVYGFAGSPSDNRSLATETAQKAVALDQNDAGAHCTLGRIRYLCRDYAAAISELELALSLNPSLALAHYGLGAAFVFSGRPHEAFPHLQSAIRLSPQDPNIGSYLVRFAEAKYLVGDDEAAVHFALKALAQPSFQWSRYAILIAALGQLGRREEAQRYVAEVTEKRPNFSVAFVQTMHPFSRDMGIDRYYEGLRKAGVPEMSA
ncbi:MAG TPA: winged helix-turn-helix domain-containing tetratricopeptide repeat protein [Pseudolabrys sp.]|nr:winged helix-turn-helix domain-containing tetratricopeptide repeat protein [Pseudolabrys sp.]